MGSDGTTTVSVSAFMSLGGSVGAYTKVLTVNPTLYSQVGTYHVKLAVSNTYGGSVTVNAIQIIVECRITSVSSLVTPTDDSRTYTLH